MYPLQRLPDGLQLGRAVRGRRVAEIPATPGAHELDTQLARGVYFYQLGGETRKMVGAPKRISIDVASYDKALEEYLVNVVAEGCARLDTVLYLEDDMINFRHLIMRAELQEEHVVNGTAVTGDCRYFIDSGVLNLTTDDDEVHSGAIGADGEFSVTIPASYDLEDTVEVSISGHPEYDNGTMAVFGKDGVACMNRIADAVNVYPGQDERVRVPISSLATTSGVFVSALEDSNAADDVLIEMARNYLSNEGVVPWVVPDMNLYNWQLEYPSLDPITSERSALHSDVMRVFVDGYQRPNTGIVFANVDSTSGESLPPQEGTVFIYQYEGVGPGNGRFPNGAEYMLGAEGHTRASDGYIRLFSEIAEAMGANDWSQTGNADPALDYEPGTDVVNGLSNRGYLLTTFPMIYDYSSFKDPSKAIDKVKRNGTSSIFSRY